MIVSDKMNSVLEYYNNGLALYKKRQFDMAISEFRKALEIHPDDGPSHLYIERCETFIKSPPPEDWDGVYTMTTK
jgi:tetratricopeptide (TPR) repeat protein